MTKSRLADLAPMLMGVGQLLTTGWTSRSITSAVQRRQLVRLSRGWYVRATDWETLSYEDRHLLRALTAQAAAHNPPVFSHFTAALMLGLPLVNFPAERVHTIASATSQGLSTSRVIQHRLQLLDDEVERTYELRHTNIVRTVLDVARVASFECAIVCADAAVRRLAQEGKVDAERVRAVLLNRLAEMPKSKGSRKAMNVIRFAEAEAESPLESISRLQLVRLGFTVALQVPVEGPEGRSYRMDIELVGYDAFGESDGKAKYIDERLRGGRSIEEVVLREKKRDNWVQGKTNKRVIHWGWDDVKTPELLAARLRAFGIEPPLGGRSGARRDLY